jgi:thioredoxin-dependent peroxiredoxin
MSIRLGDLAPNFEAESTVGPIRFYDWLGDSWGLLLSHSSDFTPVCTTELGEMAQLYDEFARRNVKVLFVSLNDLKSHWRWMKDIQETKSCAVNFPIIADTQQHISNLYEMMHPNSQRDATIRSAYIIGPNKRVKMNLNYPTNTGRNFHEILRVIDSLQLTDRHQVGTPANWTNGDDCVILPNVKEEEIAEKFPKGHRTIRPYLRYTPQPESKTVSK